MPAPNYESLSKQELIKLLTERDSDVEANPYKKKYGLVWENKPEQFDADSVGKIPVLKRDASKCILTNPDRPTHVLIKGDNYHALKVLAYTHERSVDVIYIDPPYNTGNKDFKYNDKFVDREDGYRHSKWLSFMAKRLRLAKTLLKDTGAIFLSIDDSEIAQLKLLCDDVFGADNWVVTAPVITNLKGNNDQFGFAGTHEYVLCYARAKAMTNIVGLPVSDEEADDWLTDEQGPYKIGANLKATGQNAPRAKRPNLFFPLYVSADGSFSTSRTAVTQEEVLPISDGVEMSWRWQRSTFERDWFDVVVRGKPGSYALYKKQRPGLGELPSKKAKSVLYHPGYSTGNATGELKDVFGGDRVFTGPKSTKFLRDLIGMTCPKGGIVLDFFAGSGSTAHAVMQLNAEDGGGRQCILVTNDEGEFKADDGSALRGGICTHVTHPRLKKVIEGYTTPKGKDIAGLGENLVFFDTEFVEDRALPRSRKELSARSAEMLCLRESCFIEEGSTDKRWRSFTDGHGKRLVVVTDEFAASDLRPLLKEDTRQTLVYVFRFGDEDDPAREYGGKGLEHVTAKPVPDSLLALHRRIQRQEAS